MTDRLLYLVSWLTVKHPLLVIGAAVLVTAGLCLNIPNLKMRTNLIDLFGDSSPEWRAVREFYEKFG